MYMDNILANVAEAIEATVSEGSIPPGTFGLVYGATSALRSAGASEAQLRLTEDLSVALLKFEWAIRRNDPAIVEALRDQLYDLGAALTDVEGPTPAPPKGLELP